MILGNTSAEITMSTSTAATLFVSTSYVNLTTTTLTGVCDNIAFVSATTAVIVSNPAASTQKQVKNIKIYNYDTISNLITVFHNDGLGATGVVFRATLQGSESVEYDGSHWIYYDTNGTVKSYNALTFTGDATGTGYGDITLTIPANTVTNAKAAQMATMTIKGNDTAATANAQDLTVNEVVTMINGRMLAQTKGYNLI
jgi:hypothetical protein